MRAVVMTEFGEPDVLQIQDVSDPVPGPDELLVKVHASGLNRADLLQRRGLYPAPPGESQDIPGLEFAGTVARCGDRVLGWEVGDPVMGIVAGGGYAEQVVVHSRVAVPAPEGMDPATAGAIPEVFMTAYDAVFAQAGLGVGETLLIHAVGSGVGTAAVQLARRAGARTLGTSRTPDKLAAAAELGLDVAIPGDDEWSTAVLDATDGRGVDVILDLVGGPYLEGNVRAIARRGRHVVVGVPGGPKATINLRDLMVRRSSIRGTVLRARPLEEKAALAQVFGRTVGPGFADGSLRPVIDEVFPADRAAEAHAYMEANRNFGKILLAWTD